MPPLTHEPQEVASKKQLSKFSKFSKYGVSQLNQSDGKDLAGDTLFTGSIDDALLEFGRLLPDAIEETKAKRRDMWEFRHLRLDLWEGATMDDLYRGYLRWTVKEEAHAETGDTSSDSDSDSPPSTTYNVSKAIRRVTALARWFHDHGEDVDLHSIENIDEFVRPIYNHLGIHIGRVDERLNAVIFCCDVSNMLEEGAERIPDKSMLQFSVWLCIKLSLDPDIQLHGLAIIEDLRWMSLGKMMSAFDMNTKKKSDALFQTASPIKMKKIVMANSPWWMRWMTSLFKVFLSKKIKERMVIMGTDWTKMHECVNDEDLPRNFLTGTGTIEDRYYGGYAYVDGQASFEGGVEPESNEKDEYTEKL